MSFKFLRSWLDVVGLLALLIAFFAILVYARPTYGGVVTIYDQNGVPHQYVVPDDNSGPVVPVASDGRITPGPAIDFSTCTCPVCGNRHSQGSYSAWGDPTQPTNPWGNYRSYVRTTSYGSSGGYSYGSSGGTATPTQVMSLPRPKAIIQKIRSLLKRGNQQAANASSTTTEIYSIGAVEAPTPLPSFVDSDLDRAVAALEEHNRLDRELTAKADAIERRALALAANQPEPPQYYANSDPPHGRIVPTPGPPKPHPPNRRPPPRRRRGWRRPSPWSTPRGRSAR